MKRFVIPVICFFLIVGTVIFFPVAKRYRINGFYKEFAYIHMLTWNQLEPRYVRAQSDQGTVRLTEGNLNYAATAIMRISSMDFLFFKPNTDGMEKVSLRFPDGALIEVFDAGRNKNNKDVTYVISTYEGKTRSFEVVGMAAFSRVYDCVSPEGFGNMGVNFILSE